MFLDDKPGGERPLPLCVMCRAPIIGEPVDLNDIPEMAGLYHASCITSIASILHAYRMLSRNFGG